MTDYEDRARTEPDYIVLAKSLESARVVLRENGIEPRAIVATGQRSGTGLWLFDVAVEVAREVSVLVEGGTPVELQGSADEIEDRLRARIERGDVGSQPEDN